MKVNIVEKQEQPMLYRTEVKAEVTFDREVPSRSFMKEQVAKALKADQQLLIIREIKSGFSERKAEVYAYLYKDKDKLDKFVKDYLKKRNENGKKEESSENSE